MAACVEKHDPLSERRPEFTNPIYHHSSMGIGVPWEAEGRLDRSGMLHGVGVQGLRGTLH